MVRAPRGRGAAAGAGRRDVGLRLDVAAAGRDAVPAAAPRGAVVAPPELQQPAARRRHPGPGEESRQHPPQHLPALRHEPPGLLPCGGGGGHGRRRRRLEARAVLARGACPVLGECVGREALALPVPPFIQPPSHRGTDPAGRDTITVGLTQPMRWLIHRSSVHGRVGFELGRAYLHWRGTETILATC